MSANISEEKSMQIPYVPVSWGELMDKISILKIKHKNIHSTAAQDNILRELKLLIEIAKQINIDANVAMLVEDLSAVNSKLWDIEEAIRAEDAAGRFGDRFIELARFVYVYNDERANIKRQINASLSSVLVEVKSYIHDKQIPRESE